MSSEFWAQHVWELQSERGDDESCFSCDCDPCCCDDVHDRWKDSEFDEW